MSDDEKPERRFSPVEGLAPEVSRRLRRLLDEVPTPFPCHYACFIHPRRRKGEQGFGVITPAGESLPLSVAMLASLRHVPTLFEGRSPVVVGPATASDSVIPSEDGSWSVPLPVPRLMIRFLPTQDVDGEEGDDQEPESEGTDEIIAPSAGGPHISLLCATRPAGWPA